MIPSVDICRFPRNVRTVVLGFFLFFLLFFGSFLVKTPVYGTDKVSQDLSNTEVTVTISRMSLRKTPIEYLRKTFRVSDTVPKDVILEQFSGSADDYYRAFSTNAGYFYPSSLRDLSNVFSRWIEGGEKFVDLGSGDGRVVFLADYFGAEATGLEYDPKLVRSSRQAKRKLAEELSFNTKSVNFIETNYFDQNWSKYDLIYYYGHPDSKKTDRVQQKILRESPPETKIMVYLYPGETNLDPLSGLERIDAYPEYPPRVTDSTPIILLYER